MVRSATRGGTLFVELLIVMAIITVLVSLLLSGIVRSREAARRSTCRNNLRQISLALHNYENVHTVFPPGCVNDDGPVRSEAKGYHAGWILQLLPSIEQEQIYKVFDTDESIYVGENAQQRLRSISSFVCPADETPPWVLLGLSSYAGCHHDEEAAIDVDNTGALVLNRALGAEAFVDGLSKTLFVGEKRLLPDDLGWASGTRATLRNAGWPLNATTARPATELQFAAEDPLYVGGFNSAHEQGVMFAFGDGSVRMLPNELDRLVLKRLANRADGAMVGTFGSGLD